MEDTNTDVSTDDQTQDDAQTQIDTTDDQQTDDTQDQQDDSAVLRAELQRARRELANLQKERRAQEREAKKNEDQRKAEQGQWKELAEERAKEADDLKAQLSERDRKDAERGQRDMATTVAERLNFRSPRRAYALLLDEFGQEETANALADEQLTESALRKLSKSDPYLIDAQRRSGAPVNGSRGQAVDPEKAFSQWIGEHMGAFQTTE